MGKKYHLHRVRPLKRRPRMANLKTTGWSQKKETAVFYQEEDIRRLYIFWSGFLSNYFLVVRYLRKKINEKALLSFWGVTHYKTVLGHNIAVYIKMSFMLFLTLPDRSLQRHDNLLSVSPRWFVNHLTWDLKTQRFHHNCKMRKLHADDRVHALLLAERK